MEFRHSLNKVPFYTIRFKYVVLYTRFNASFASRVRYVVASSLSAANWEQKMPKCLPAATHHVRPFECPIPGFPEGVPGSVCSIG